MPVVPKINPQIGAITSEDSVKVMMQCSHPGAKIYYTMDGSEPTLQATLYKTAITIKLPAFIRAKAFKKGALDLYGDYAFYLRPEKKPKF